MEDRTISVNINFSVIAKTVIFLILIWVLYQLSNLVLVVLTAVVIASGIEPATRWLTRYRIPRIIAVIFLYVFTFGFFFGVFYSILPPLVGDLRGVVDQLPSYLDQIELPQSATVGEKTFDIQLPQSFSLKETVNALEQSVAGIQQNVLGLFSVVFGGVLSFILIVVISFYLAVQERGIENFLSTITPIKYEQYIIGLWRRAQRKIGLWLRGQLLLAVLIGLLVYLSLTIFGIRYALLLAIIAGMFELIPIFGPILAAVPAILIGFIDGGPGTALIVIALYVIIQQFENQLIYPLVVRQVVGVPPIIAIIALMAGGSLAGILGIILSIPLAAVAMELFNDLDKEKNVLRERNTHTNGVSS